MKIIKLPNILFALPFCFAFIGEMINNIVYDVDYDADNNNHADAEYGGGSSLCQKIGND